MLLDVLIHHTEKPLLALSRSKLYLILKAQITFYIILGAMGGSAGNNFLTELVPRLQPVLSSGACALFIVVNSQGSAKVPQSPQVRPWIS